MNPNAVSMMSGEKTNGKGLKIIIATVSVIAICCIGISIYSFIESNNKSQEITSLKTEIEEKNKVIEEKDKTIEEKDKAIAEKEKTIEDQTGSGSGHNKKDKNECVVVSREEYIKTQPLPKL